MPQPPPQVFRDLLERAKLSADEAAGRVQRALDPGYWQALLPPAPGPPPPGESSPPAPGRSTGGERVGAAARPAYAPPGTGDAAIAAAVADFTSSGVYRLSRALDASMVQRLNAIVDAVLAAGWPAVFAFAYDELWECARIDPIRRLATGALGAGAKQIPHVWVHVLRPGGGAAGWSPHIDGPGNDRLTAWIALSPAGLDEGCMFAVPRDEAVARAVAEWRERDALEKAHVKTLLQGARAMPAAAGDVLGWGFDIIHWGGVVAPGGAGRRSVSLEFIGPDAAPGPTDEPLVSLDAPLPPHRDRMRAIGAALLEYRKFEPLIVRFQDVARRLAAAG
jgi:hypothetical protein